MIDFGKVRQSLLELRNRLEEVELQIADLETQAAAAERRSLLVRTPGEAAVIPPTLTVEGVQHIVGGVETPDFSDCCAVGNSAGFFCSGTLIAANVVVTARHCVNASRVFLNGVDVEDLGAGEVIGVSAHFAHPTADLQVLLLEGDSQVDPRHVAQGHEVNAATCTLVGFGTTEPTGHLGYGKKRRVDGIPIKALDCGNAAAQNEFGCRGGTELVAGQRGLNRDSCQGDSGGPLYIKNAEGGFDLLGATSRGVRKSNVCGDGGIYVRVDRFVDWIHQMTGVDIPGPRL